MLQHIDKKIAALGYSFTTSDLTMDGSRHDIMHESIKGQYVGSITPEYVSLTFWDWRSGGKHALKETIPGLSKKKINELTESQKQEAEKMEAEKKRLHESVAIRAHNKYAALKPTKDKHPYLITKGLYDLWGKRAADDGTFLGARIIRDNQSNYLRLIIPTRDVNGKLWGWQEIAEDGQKMFLDSQRTIGLMHVIGKVDPNDVLYICEGFATAATIAGASGRTTACAFNASNLTSVGEALREAYPHLRIVFSGDEDFVKLDGKGNPHRTGYRAARKAAHRSKGSLIRVSFKGVPQDLFDKHKPTDYNDLLLLHPDGAKEVHRQISNHHAITPLEFIGTEYAGFHDEIMTRTGVKHVPNYPDLLKLFRRQHTYRMLSTSKQCFCWDGKKYIEWENQRIEAFAQDHFEVDDRQVCSNVMAAEFLGLVHRSDQTPVEWFYETTKNKINFQNGVLDLETDTFTPHTHKIGFRGILSYEYNPDATCPNFDIMMERITQGDKVLKQMLLEYMGYCVSSDEPWLQTALICIGTGANGKSTFLDVIRDMCGPDNTASVMISELSHEYSRIRLDGKLANISEENNPKKIDSEIFKTLVAGGMCAARKPYKSGYEFRNRAKFVLAFNQFDRSPDSSEGFSRRLLLAPFDAVFDKTTKDYDPHIGKKLKEELSGIFNKALAAYRLCKLNGSLTEPDSVRIARHAMKLASDPVAMFFEDQCSVANGQGITADSLGADTPNYYGVDEKGPYVCMAELYGEYRMYCDTNGYYPVSNVVFGRSLSRLLKKKGVTDASASLKKQSGKVFRVMRGVVHNSVAEY